MPPDPGVGLCPRSGTCFSELSSPPAPEPVFSAEPAPRGGLTPPLPSTVGVILAQEGSLCIRAPGVASSILILLWTLGQSPHQRPLQLSLTRMGFPYVGGGPFRPGRRGCACERPGDCPIPWDREAVEQRRAEKWLTTCSRGEEAAQRPHDGLRVHQRWVSGRVTGTIPILFVSRRCCPPCPGP